MPEFLIQGPIFLFCLVFFLGIVIIVHELGHYLTARYFGAAVEMFSIGFGAPIRETMDKRGTRWRISWLPLGGFVKFSGETDEKSRSTIVGKPYRHISPLARAAIILGGPAANFILAIVLFACLFGIKGVERYDISIHDLTPGSPAARAGAQQGDVIAAINGKTVENIGDIIAVTTISTGRPLDFNLVRDGQMVNVWITPERITRENPLGQIVPQGTIGVRLHIDPDSIRQKRFGPVGAVIEGIAATGQTVQNTVFTISRIISGQEPITIMSGPVGFADTGRHIVNRTLENDNIPLKARWVALFWSAIHLCALLSVGVGFFNLLPLPVLDGGHLLFTIYEILTRKTVPEKIQEMAFIAGFGLLMTLFILITIDDIGQTGLFSQGIGG